MVVLASLVRLPKLRPWLPLPPPSCRSMWRVCKRQSTPRLSRSAWLMSMMVTSISTRRGLTSSDSIRRRYCAILSGVSRTITALSRVSAWNCGNCPPPQLFCVPRPISPPPIASSICDGSALGMPMPPPPPSPMRSLAWRVAPRLVLRLGPVPVAGARLRPYRLRSTVTTPGTVISLPARLMRKSDAHEYLSGKSWISARSSAIERSSTARTAARTVST
ncbi:hypothetical protein D3C72_1690150 [compost metagenome]